MRFIFSAKPDISRESRSPIICKQREAVSMKEEKTTVTLGKIKSEFTF